MQYRCVERNFVVNCIISSVCAKIYKPSRHHPKDAPNDSRPNGDNSGKYKFFGISSGSISTLKKFESSNVARDSSASQCSVDSAENGIPTPMTPLGSYIPTV